MRKFVLTITLCLFPITLYAEPARQIDFSQPVIGLDGKPYSECVQISDDGKRCLRSEVLPLGKMVAAALSMPPSRTDTPLNLLDQLTRGKLAQRLLDAKSEALSSADLTLIKDQLAKAGLPPVTLLHAVEAIDPASVH